MSASPYVRLTESPGDIRYIETASRQRLRQLQGRHATYVASGWQPIGLTLAELGLGISVSVRSEVMSDGRFCSVLSAVEATVGYDVIDVYIAREYQRGSCQYSVILNHERQHVVVFETTLNEHIPLLLQVLERTAEEMRPIKGRDRNRAARDMQAKMQDAAREVLDRIGATLDRRNARLDTDDQYRREQRQCAHW